MKQFFIVLKFELLTMLGKKSFRISTILIMLLIFAGFSVPRFGDLFSGSKDVDPADQDVIEIFDAQSILSDKAIVEAALPGYTIRFATSLETMKENVKSEEVKYGYEVVGPTAYTSYVNNSSMFDQESMKFSEVLKRQYQANTLQEKGYDLAEVEAIYNTEVMQDTQILGKDGVSNYFYTYILVILIFMMVVIYGNQIGVGVASEKSNRAIEILVTSCSSNALIFGKVIAGVMVGAIQTILLIGSTFLAYKINADAWGNALDMYFQIPVEVMITFAVFGLLGYLLYSFLFGAIGATVSKVEEVNGATMPVQLCLMACYFVGLMAVQMPDSTMAVFASYFPFTSCIAMFIRIALGTASMLEVLVSASILLVTTIAMGLLGAKLYRRGTLSYGNNIKFKHMIKMLKQKD